MNTVSYPELDQHVINWLEALSLSPPPSEHLDWGFKITFSTVPPVQWAVRRSRIGPNELWFGVGLSRLTGWTATLFPRDEAFKVVWRSTGRMDVISQFHRFRCGVNWPTLSSLDQLPQAIKSFEDIFSVRFHRSAEFLGPSLKTADFSVLAGWLGSACDELLCMLGTVHGPLPAHADVTDSREKRGASR